MDAAGQRYLNLLLEIILADAVAQAKPEYEVLVRAVDVDGYSVVGGRLVPKDAAAPIVAEQRAYLEGLYASLGLDEHELARKHYQQSEDDYVVGAWGSALITCEFVLLRLANTKAPATLAPVRQQVLSVLGAKLKA